jgi:uridylate kinase
MYKKVLLKVSGEVFGGDREGLDYNAISQVAKQIADASELNVSIGVVVGGGNIIRGTDSGKFGV